jgi:hypothetical protein
LKKQQIKVTSFLFQMLRKSKHKKKANKIGIHIMQETNKELLHRDAFIREGSWQQDKEDFSCLE